MNQNIINSSKGRGGGSRGGSRGGGRGRGRGRGRGQGRVHSKTMSLHEFKIFQEEVHVIKQADERAQQAEQRAQQAERRAQQAKKQAEEAATEIEFRKAIRLEESRVKQLDYKHQIDYLSMSGIVLLSVLQKLFPLIDDNFKSPIILWTLRQNLLLLIESLCGKCDDDTKRVGFTVCMHILQDCALAYIDTCKNGTLLDFTGRIICVNHSIACMVGACPFAHLPDGTPIAAEQIKAFCVSGVSIWIYFKGRFFATPMTIELLKQPRVISDIRPMLKDAYHNSRLKFSDTREPYGPAGFEIYAVNTQMDMSSVSGNPYIGASVKTNRIEDEDELLHRRGYKVKEHRLIKFDIRRVTDALPTIVPSVLMELLYKSGVPLELFLVLQIVGGPLGRWILRYVHHMSSTNHGNTSPAVFSSLRASSEEFLEECMGPWRYYTIEMLREFGLSIDAAACRVVALLDMKRLLSVLCTTVRFLRKTDKSEHPYNFNEAYAQTIVHVLGGVPMKIVEKIVEKLL